MSKQISKTLIVGLGGTGQKTIKAIKKRLLRTYGEIPSLVMFVAFDTDKLDNENEAFRYYYDGQSYEDYRYHIANSEFLQIPRPGKNVVEKDPVCADKLNLSELETVYNLLGGHGANGYRVMGRAHFLNWSKQIIKLLTETVTELKGAPRMAEAQDKGYVLNGTEINVFVIASLAGGTGSSAFMDISRMLQIAGVNVQYAVSQQSDKIFGMFFLPKFFENYPNTENIEVNAYTALSELDYTLGLGNTKRYAPQSPAVADDNQDYQGYTDRNERVHYSGVYLIDALTSIGQTHNINDASNYVASFIASSISANSASILSAFVNSDHKLENVDGKYQNYSSLGYCELRFDRQNLVKYLLNKKLIDVVGEYKNGDSTLRPIDIVNHFIDDNQLNEGVEGDGQEEDTRSALNQLTDAIIDLRDERLVRPVMATVDTGKDAATNIENNKTRYLNEIGTITSTMVRDYERNKTQIKDNLRSTLDQYQSGRGFGMFPDLALTLKTTFVAMKEGLEKEMAVHEERFNAIETELAAVRATIDENTSKGFLGIGNKRDEQERAINRYCNKVRFAVGNEDNPTLAWLKAQMARKAEAVAIYDDLIAIVESYYKKEKRETINGEEVIITGSYLRIGNMFDGLNDLLVAENNGYRPSGAAVNETVYADAYFKRYFEEHWDGTMNLQNQQASIYQDYIMGLFANNEAVTSNLISQMRDRLLELLPQTDTIKLIKGFATKVKDNQGNTKEIRHIMSIDELFIHCFGKYADIPNKNDSDGNPSLRILNQVVGLFDTLWQYQEFRGQGLEPEKHMIVGVNDTQANIFNNKNGYMQHFGGWKRIEPIGLGDPDRIVFLLMETAIPGFKLMNADTWANDFKQRRNRTYTFSDKRYEDIEMLMPNANDEAEIAWAYGWLFGYITNPRGKKGLRVRPTRGYLERAGGVPERNGDYNYFVTLTNPGDIAHCHRKFVNDEELSNDIYNRVMFELDRDPIGSIIKLKKWVNDERMWDEDVRGKLRKSMSPKEKEVVDRELKFLKERFARIGFGLTLDDNGKVTHNTSEDIIDREAQESRKNDNAKDEQE